MLILQFKKTQKKIQILQFHVKGNMRQSFTSPVNRCDGKFERARLE